MGPLDSLYPLIFLLIGKLGAFDGNHECRYVDPDGIVFIAKRVFGTTICKSYKFMISNLSDHGVGGGKIVSDIPTMI